MSSQQPYQQPKYGKNGRLLPQQQAYEQPYAPNYPQQQPYGHHGQQLVPQHHYQQRPMPTASPKSPGVALILSIIVCGLGQLYTGNPIWAVIWFGSAVLCGIVFFPLAFVVIFCAAIHAYMCASAFNRRHHAIR